MLRDVLDRFRLGMILLACLLTISASVSLAGQDDPTWQAHVDPSGQIFPSMVLGMATATAIQGRDEPLDVPETAEAQAIADAVAAQTLGDPRGWIYVTLRAPKDRTQIRVTISCDEIMEPSTYRGVLEKAGAFYGIAPRIRWKYQTLAAIRQPSPVNVVFQVAIDGSEVDEQVQVATLHTINDCPILHVEEDADTGLATIRDLSPMFAAYVNEDHPWVDALLSEAIGTHLVDQFTGYQLGNADEVFKQVYAVWNVLQQRGLTYSDISRTSSREGTVPSQHVRLLDESIAMKQANCVDGSVLLASILRKIGIDVFLMSTPTHCYIGFFTDAGRATMAGLETTMLGQARKDEFERTKTLRSLLNDDRTFSQASFDSFNAALAVGTKNLEADVVKIQAGEFQYIQVLINEAREQGIRAIPYVAPPAVTIPGRPAAPDAQQQLRDELESLRIPEPSKDPGAETPADDEPKR